MMSTRLGSLLLALLFVMTALAGCHGLEDEDGGDATPSPTATSSPTASPTTSPTTSPSPTPTGSPGPDETVVNITILDAPDNVDVGETITINISVAGDEMEATAADLYFAYESTLPIDEADLTPDHFNGSVEGNGNRTFPGRYAVENWTIDDNRSLFIRAHVIYQGDHYWSNETIIAVNEPEEEQPIEKITEVIIDTNPQQFPCNLANFQGQGGAAWERSKHVITEGEAVVWVSQETAEDCVHTATSTADPPVFDTGDIQNGETTEAFLFLEPGTYEYECTYHPDTMTGTIEVQQKLGP